MKVNSKQPSMASSSCSFIRLLVVQSFFLSFQAVVPINKHKSFDSFHSMLPLLPSELLCVFTSLDPLAIEFLCCFFPPCIFSHNYTPVFRRFHDWKRKFCNTVLWFFSLTNLFENVNEAFMGHEELKKMKLL